MNTEISSVSSTVEMSSTLSPVGNPLRVWNQCRPTRYLRTDSHQARSQRYICLRYDLMLNGSCVVTTAERTYLILPSRRRCTCIVRLKSSVDMRWSNSSCLSTRVFQVVLQPEAMVIAFV